MEQASSSPQMPTGAYISRNPKTKKYYRVVHLYKDCRAIGPKTKILPATPTFVYQATRLLGVDKGLCKFCLERLEKELGVYRGSFYLKRKGSR